MRSGIRLSVLGLLSLVVGLMGSCSTPPTPQAAPPWFAGTPSRHDLVIAENGKTDAVVAVAPAAGPMEKAAAEDLVKYIELMAGAKPAVVGTADAVAAALQSKAPVFLIGTEALKADPSLQERLRAAAKQNPELRADAIVLKRDGRRVFLAGTNDEAHYYAVAELLKCWGCRWYMQTEFGECIPTYSTLSIGDLDYAYGSPFEIRNYWLSWNGDDSGRAEFQRRNMLNSVTVPCGHCLGSYVQALVPPGKTIMNIPIAERSTAEHVAKQIAERYAKGEYIMLGMEDGVYQSDSPLDKELMGLQFDKYFMLPSMTDAFMVFYNNVADILMKQYPDSKARIGFLMYCNITLPPVRPITLKKPLVGYLAPIDIDPIHGMDDPNSPPRQEYRDMVYAWSKIMQGRVAIYDYDQGMLIWRDIPNPAHQSFRQDVKHYQKAGILGVGTESRGAFATTWLNLYLRAQLLWNPDVNVNVLLDEFYPKFYGPAAEPMKAYWTTIYKAWETTLSTEHEYMAAPAIYTPEMIATLRKNVAEADALIKPLSVKPNPARNEKLYLERMRFMHLAFGVLENYIAMVNAAAEIDYAKAVKFGEAGLAVREQTTAMNGIFTTYKVMGEGGPAWWPGEVQQYRDLNAMTDGSKGKLLQVLPLEWAFHRDPKDQGLKEGWAAQPIDLTFWKTNGKDYTPDSRKDYPVTEWETLRTDLYAQAQGIRDPDRQSFTGYLWYRTDVDIKADAVSKPVHLRFPGLFNECWLYVNGQEVAHRPFDVLWWHNDYTFEWDVDLTGELKEGANTIALRCYNPHHWGGMFRRPFLYEPTGKQGQT